jgi:tape measure domain-containing protein
MKGATNGLSDIDKGIKSLGGNGLAGLASGIDAVTSKFSTLGIIGVTTLANITNSAVNAGKNLTKALTIDPIKTGFEEYETKINAIQTILTNTAHQGTTLKDVTGALDELNTYADKTIYNFSEMTKNIGTFTAAGIDLKTATTSIKGIANLAAGSGSNPVQASTAMYQLSQALAAGKVSLMDWNSVVNAGMGGKLFQDALLDTAKGMGKVVDAGKPFRETLQDGWLTSDVLTKTLTKFANDKSLVQAATQVKTFTGLMDTMKESVQSGWAQSMEQIFGNKDQAAKLFTSMSEGFNDIIGPSADARNEMLKFWNVNGGREDVIKGITNIILSLSKGINAVKDAFKDVFPPTTGKQLVDLSKGFKNLTEKFKMNDKTAKMIHDTFKGVFSVIDFGMDAIGTLVTSLDPLSGLFSGIGNALLVVTSSIGEFFTSITNGAKQSGLLDKMTKGIENTFNRTDKFLSDIANGVGELFSALAKLNFKPIFDFISAVGSGLGSGFKSIFGGLGEAISNINFNTLIGAIGALAAGKGLGALDNITSTIKGSFDSILGITDNVSGILDGVRESLQAYQDNLNAGTLLKLAISIGILAGALALLSSIDAKSMETALTGITMLFIELMAGLAVLLKVVAGTSIKGFFSVSMAMVQLSASILLLSFALKNISGLKWDELARGLVGIAGAMGVLVAAVKLMSGKHKGLMRTATAMIVLSIAIKSMAGAVKMFGELNPETLMKGLLGVGAVLAELALFLSFTNFKGLKNSFGILVLAVALNVLASAVSKFGALDTGALLKGIAGIGAILLELSLLTKLMGSGIKLMLISTGLIALGVALNLISGAVKSMGSLSLESIGKGLLGIAGSLLIISAAVRLIPATSLIATSIGIGLMSMSLGKLADVLKSMGGMSWDEIGKSMVALSGSLVILAIAMATMMTGLPGAAAMLVMSAALALFIPQLVSLSNLSLTQVGVGLLAMAGAFTVLGLAGLFLTPLVPAIISLSGAVALFGLGCLAAGVGVSLFATGLTALIAVVAAGGFGLVNVLTQLIGLLPELGVKMAEGIVNFITSIGESIPKIVTAFGQMITGILQAFIDALPKLAETVGRLIETMVTVITNALPKLLDLGVKIILSLLDGIARNIGKLTTTAISIIVSFINTIAANLGRIIQAGINLAIAFINGMANGIRKNSPAVSAACMNLITAVIGAIGVGIEMFLTKGSEAVGKFAMGILRGLGKVGKTGLDIVVSTVKGITGGIGQMVTVGSNMIAGFIKGVKNKAGDVVRAAKGVVQGAIDGAKALLDIHSPSRVFQRIGDFTVMGFVKGLRNNVKMAGNSARDMASSAIDNMKKPLTKVAELLSGEIDATPVIAPVMDLSNIEKGSRTLKQLLAEKTGLQLDANASGGLSKSIKKIQNGSNNSDLLSALKDLKNEISNVGGTTYQVNGITYDNGSSVSTAVESLVHAAKIERRI